MLEGNIAWGILSTYLMTIYTKKSIEIYLKVYFGVKCNKHNDYFGIFKNTEDETRILTKPKDYLEIFPIYNNILTWWN